MIKKVASKFKEEEYLEKYNHARGVVPGTQGGFARLVRNYPGVKRVMDKPHHFHSDGTIYYNHLQYRRRVPIFIRTKWKRLAMCAAFAGAFNFIGNASGLIFGGTERGFKTWKHQWLIRNYPSLILYKSAQDTQFQLRSMSQMS
jgi:hypothetical protein